MNSFINWISANQQIIYIVILMIFVGIEVIGRVPSVLHTPLMSGANAIHGVVIIGAIIVMGKAEAIIIWHLYLGFLAVILGTLNVVGGFVVTDRMLEMFKSKKKKVNRLMELRLNILTLIYLIASVTFIIGLKMLSHPETARKGNLDCCSRNDTGNFRNYFYIQGSRYRSNSLHNYGWIFGGLVIGGIIGALAAKKVKMTAMPEMVSMFNGMGGACAALISIVEFNHFLKESFVIRVDDPMDTSVFGTGYCC